MPAGQPQWHRGAPALVVGIGNPLAGDDAAGPLVAGSLIGRPGLDVRICHQLTPELAVDVAQAEQVVFVDAARGGRGVGVRRLIGVRPDGVNGTQPLAHTMSPQAVLALAKILYGRAPIAHLVTIRGQRFEIGFGLSGTVRRRIPTATRAVARLLRGGT